MFLTKRRLIIASSLVLLAILIVIFYISFSQDEPNTQVTFRQALKQVFTPPSARYEALPKEINVLALGLDCRKGVTRGRSDAIHLITYTPSTNKISILSFGRDTPIKSLPLTPRLKNLREDAHILGHIYPIYGRDALIELLENCTGKKIDYYAEVGFSQVIGFCDYIGLNGVDVLKHLRHRKTLKGGSFQRGLNQGEFIKWLIEAKAKEASENPKKTMLVAYSFLKTDFPPKVLQNVLYYIKKHPLRNRDIEVNFYGYKGLEFKGFDPEVSVKETNRKIENLRESWDEEEEEIFNKSNPDLANYLYPKLKQAESLIRKGNSKKALDILKRPFEQQLYWQIPEKEGRATFHIWLVRLYARACIDTGDEKSGQDALLFINDYYKKGFTVWQDNEATPRVSLRKRIKKQEVFSEDADEEDAKKDEVAEKKEKNDKATKISPHK